MPKEKVSEKKPLIARMGKDGKPDYSDIRPFHVSLRKMEMIDGLRGNGGSSSMQILSDMENLMREKNEAQTEGMECPQCGHSGIGIFSNDPNGLDPRYICRKCNTTFNAVRKYEYHGICRGSGSEKSGEET